MRHPIVTSKPVDPLTAIPSNAPQRIALRD